MFAALFIVLVVAATAFAIMLRAVPASLNGHLKWIVSDFNTQLRSVFDASSQRFEYALLTSFQHSQPPIRRPVMFWKTIEFDSAGSPSRFISLQDEILEDRAAFVADSGAEHNHARVSPSEELVLSRIQVEVTPALGVPARGILRGLLVTVELDGVVIWRGAHGRPCGDSVREFDVSGLRIPAGGDFGVRLRPGQPVKAGELVLVTEGHIVRKREF